MAKKRLIQVFVNTKHREKVDRILKERGLSHGDFIALSYSSLIKLENIEKVNRKISKRKRDAIEKRAVKGRKKIEKEIKKAEKLTKGVKYDKKLANKAKKSKK